MFLSLLIIVGCIILVVAQLIGRILNWAVTRYAKFHNRRVLEKMQDRLR